MDLVDLWISTTDLWIFKSSGWEWLENGWKHFRAVGIGFSPWVMQSSASPDPPKPSGTETPALPDNLLDDDQE